MDIVEIEARPREVRGSRACRRLRREELVPAIVYGRKEPGVLLSLTRGDVEHLIHDRAHVLRVNWDGHHENVQIKEVQYDALGDDVLHVDLVRISLSETVTVSVPVEIHGEAAGVAEGGALGLVHHEFEVECLPTAIPESVRIEVSQLGIGDALKVADIEFPEGVTPLDDPEAVVVTVVPPQELPEEEVPLGEELAAEPEVIGREAEQEAEGDSGKGA